MHALSDFSEYGRTHSVAPGQEVRWSKRYARYLKQHRRYPGLAMLEEHSNRNLELSFWQRVITMPSVYTVVLVHLLQYSFALEIKFQ